MSCHTCEQLVQPRLIITPDDLTKAIRSAASAVISGKLRYEGIGVCGDQFALIIDGGWGDTVNNYFSCAHCGQWFNLGAETYHGSGGAFKPISAPVDQPQKDAFPLHK